MKTWLNQLFFTYPLLRHWMLLVLHGGVAGITIITMGRIDQQLSCLSSPWVAGILISIFTGLGAAIVTLMGGLTIGHLASGEGIFNWYWPNPLNRQAKIMRYCRTGNLKGLRGFVGNQEALQTPWLGRNIAGEYGGEQDVRAPVAEAILAEQWEVADWLLNEQGLLWSQSALGGSVENWFAEHNWVEARKNGTRYRHPPRWAENSWAISNVPSDLWEKLLARAHGWLIGKTIEQAAEKVRPELQGAFMVHAMINRWRMKPEGGVKAGELLEMVKSREELWGRMAGEMAEFDYFVEFQGEMMRWQKIKGQINKMVMEQTISTTSKEPMASKRYL